MMALEQLNYDVPATRWYEIMRLFDTREYNKKRKKNEGERGGVPANVAG